MASLVLKMSVSLDGHGAPTDGGSEWVIAGRFKDGAAWTLETVSNADPHLIGVATYARWATFWFASESTPQPPSMRGSA